jgi:hypothetical protein
MRGKNDMHESDKRTLTSFTKEMAAYSTAVIEAEIKMKKSNRRVIQFLEKEIKTYVALALYLSKEGLREPVHVGCKDILMTPAFYKERMREAKNLVSELRK